MAKNQLDRDELNDQEDEQAALTEDQTKTSQQEGDDDDAPDSSDEYDIRNEMDDNDNHVLSLLTDDELAALNGDDEDEGEEDDPQPAAAQEDDPAQAGNPAQDQAAQAQPQSFELSHEQIDQINAEAKAARQEALDKWRDGDMTDEELQGAIDAAEQSKEEAYIAAMEQAEQAAQDAQIEQMKASFREVAREYLTKDYPELASDKHLAKFDRHVRIVTGSDDYAGKTHREMLEAAHRLYAAEADILGVEVPMPKHQRAAKRAAESPQKPIKSPSETSAKRSKPEVVPTLARVPAAATNTAADGKWGSIAARYQAADREGDVAGMERIMASLSDEEREAFASMDI